MKTLELKKDNRVAFIYINREKDGNMINMELIEEFSNLLSELEKDDSVLAIVVAGTGGRLFSAGADIKEFSELIKLNKVEEFQRKGQELFNRIEQYPKLIIAALNGHAFGGGFELALACDLIIADSTIRVSLPEATIGIMPGFGGTFRLASIVGKQIALEILLSGKKLKADEAFRLGIINKITETDKVLEEAKNLAEKIIKNCLPISIKFIKKAVISGKMESIEKSLKWEKEGIETMAKSTQTKEIISAVIEKRIPEGKK